MKIDYDAETGINNYGTKALGNWTGANVFLHSSVQFINISPHEKKRHTGDNSEGAELTKSTATTIVTNKIGVSINNCTLTQKSKEKVGERKRTLYKLYAVIHTLF